jgi:hypothetical protein
VSEARRVLGELERGTLQLMQHPLLSELHASHRNVEKATLVTPVSNLLNPHPSPKEKRALNEARPAPVP